jgi:hypothetical protein
MSDKKLTKEQRREANKLAHAEAQAAKYAAAAIEKESITIQVKKEKKTMDERLDDAEKSLDILINVDRNPVAIIFFLKTQGRKRGYVEHAPEDKVDLEKLIALKDFFTCISGAIQNDQETAIKKEDAPEVDVISVGHTSREFTSHSETNKEKQEGNGHAPSRKADHIQEIPIIHDALSLRLPEARPGEPANPGSYRVRSGRPDSNFP